MFRSGLSKVYVERERKTIMDFLYVSTHTPLSAQSFNKKLIKLSKKKKSIQAQGDHWA
jgi:hypothetical protein